MKKILVILGLVSLLCPFVQAAQSGTTFNAYVSTASTVLYNAPGRITNFSIINSSANVTQNVYFWDGASTAFSTNAIYGISVAPPNLNSSGSQQMNLGDSALIVRKYLSATSSDPYGKNNVQIFVIPTEGDN